MLQEIKPIPTLIQDLGRIKPKETSSYKKRFGLYRCVCGKEFKAITSSVTSERTNSCGCYRDKQQKDATTKHGMYTHRIYAIWNNMVARCNNKNDKDYINYGGRDISVCNRWLDVKNFIADMYPTFEEGLTLDRIDVNGNYEPSNCRWATKTVQARNTRVLSKKNKTGYRGVSFDKGTKKFRAFIGLGTKLKALGSFNTPIEAAIAYDSYIIENMLEHSLNNV